MKPENIALYSASTAIARTQHSIGAILIDAGRLSMEDAERVLRLQREEKLLFGEAALKLKVLKQADIDFALSRQFNYEYLQRGSSQVSESVVAAYDPFSEEVESFRTLRSQLMVRWFDGDASRKVLAIVSPEKKEGRSFVTANLAVVFAQLGERVLLVDADLRSPTQHALFGLQNRTGLSSFLSGRQEAADVQEVPGLPHLFLLSAGPVPPNPIELLSRPNFTRLLPDLRTRFDVILIDSPAALQYADAQMISVRAGGAIMVVRKDGSRAAAAAALARTVQANSTLVGTVLNEH
jgi:chain length determinant protein tyrosine kinase EpsG